MWQTMGEHGWWIGFGAVHMILFWGLIILAIVALVKILFGGTSDEGSRQSSPLELLQRRYARGDIDTEEYQRKRKQLADS